MSEPKIFGPDVYQRDKHGLFKNVDYIFHEDGSVNWRAMVKEEFLYPNHDWFKKKNKQSPSSVAGLEDNQLLISLAGIKELAQLRGFASLRYKVCHINENHVGVRCVIQWVPNYETGVWQVVSEGVASAHPGNTDAFGLKFLETIASNRAFVRCVRNFLNIHIVGSDEIDRSDNQSVGADPSNPSDSNIPTTPLGVLTASLGRKGYTDFEAFKGWLRELWSAGTYKNEEAKNWKKFEDIDPKDARFLVGILNKNK